MGISDKLGDMADETMHKAGGSEKVKGQIHKGTEAANRATGGKYEHQLDKAESGAKTAVDKHAKKKKNNKHK